MKQHLDYKKLVFKLGKEKGVSEKLVKAILDFFSEGDILLGFSPLDHIELQGNANTEEYKRIKEYAERRRSIEPELDYKRFAQIIEAGEHPLPFIYAMEYYIKAASELTTSHECFVEPDKKKVKDFKENLDSALRCMLKMYFKKGEKQRLINSMKLIRKNPEEVYKLIACIKSEYENITGKSLTNKKPKHHLLRP